MPPLVVAAIVSAVGSVGTAIVKGIADNTRAKDEARKAEAEARKAEAEAEAKRQKGWLRSILGF